MRLLLIDDHPLFRQGFAAMLAELRPAARLDAWGSAEAAFTWLAQHEPPDLALIDLALPGCDGFETAVSLSRLTPLTPRAIISGREDRAARERAQAAGASGFIVKSAPPERMLAAIDRILDGEQDWGDEADQPILLSARQQEVLALLCAGHANKEIEYRLGIAERTVRAHLTELFHALGVQTRVQAVLRARELGLTG